MFIFIPKILSTEGKHLFFATSQKKMHLQDNLTKGFYRLPPIEYSGLSLFFSLYLICGNRLKTNQLHKHTNKCRGGGGAHNVPGQRDCHDGSNNIIGNQSQGDR